MFKKRRPKRSPLPARHVFIISFIVFVLMTVQSLYMINRGIEPALMEIAETTTRQFAAQAINDSISKNISEEVDINQLIVKHETGGEPSYSFDPGIYNKLIAESTERVQQYLDYVEKGDLEKLEAFTSGTEIDFEKSKDAKGIVYYVPLGLAANNTLLANMGPQIPIQFMIIGDVQSNVETQTNVVGINNTYLEVYINISVEMNVIIPRRTKTIKVANKVKIGDLFIPGKVPDFYSGNGNGSSPAIQLPKKSE
ncbi:sporulation protein YunB [Rossellomorea marisflavi]|uniref:sporulation protein YunB n=1 Tax=Rossellomorea marisflavi TaxID=189381 RepID=UPI0035168DAF